MSGLQGMREPFYGWALDAVDGLDWLVELDGWAFEGERENLRGRHPKLIDVVHVRWAASTAATALDLCAAEVAHRYSDMDFWTEHTPVLGDVARDVAGKRYAVPQPVWAWLETVQDDPMYRVLQGTRHALTHRFIVRSANLWSSPPTGHGSRTEFAVPDPAASSARPNARELIVLARNTAERHVRACGRALEAA